jgi:polar amino acid transport system substrate-binding protein
MNFIAHTIFLLIAFALSAQAYASSECTEVNISAHPDYPPFHWREGDSDTLTGASISVTKEVLRSMGVPFRVSYEGPWKRVLKKAESGEVDIVAALKSVEERREYMVFTNNPFYFNPVAVFMRASDNREVSSLSDLDGMVGSISLGDKHGEEIDRYIDQSDRIQEVLGLESNFVILDLSRTDFFIEGLYTGRQFLDSHPLKSKVRVAKVFKANWVHHGFSKKSKCLHLLEGFDLKMGELYESGFIEQEMHRYEEVWRRSHQRETVPGKSHQRDSAPK